jgi:hypothetical protein
MCLFLLAGCGDSTGPTDIGSITVNTPQPSVAIGNTVQLSATVLNSTGATVSNASLTWSSSSDAIATVSPAGVVTGVSGGQVREAVVTAILRLAAWPAHRQMFDASQIPDPVTADYARDYASMEALGLEKFLVLDKN